MDFPEDRATVQLAGSIDKADSMGWSNYVRGICRELQEKRGYKLKGAKLAVGGNVPQGGGLSSSAALEVSVATAMNHLCDLGIGPKDLALIGQQAEWWVGCKCGIMDQFISSLGEADSALLIDCRDLSTKSVSIPAGYSVIIVNSNKKHQLAGLDSEYNQRRAQCEEAARHFGVTALRDVTSAELEVLLPPTWPCDLACVCVCGGGGWGGGGVGGGGTWRGGVRVCFSSSVCARMCPGACGCLPVSGCVSVRRR